MPISYECKNLSTANTNSLDYFAIIIVSSMAVCYFLDLYNYMLFLLDYYHTNSEQNWKVF